MSPHAAFRLIARRWMCSGRVSRWNNSIVSGAQNRSFTLLSSTNCSAFELPLTSGCFASSFPSPPEDPLGSALLDLVTYEAVSSDTLESLCEYFDRLVETAPHLKNADITFSVKRSFLSFNNIYLTIKVYPISI